MAPLSAEFFGGRDELQLPAGSLFELVRGLDALSPGFAEEAEGRVAFAIDGVLTGDWSSALLPNSEVLLVPRIAGG